MKKSSEDSSGVETPSTPDGGGDTRADATRAAILDAAHELFVSKGPDATSIRDIARAADVTKSLIHHHFGSKEALYDHVCNRAFETYWAQQKALLESPAGADEQLLVESMRTFFRFHIDNPDFVRLSAHHLVRSMTGDVLGSPGGEGRFDLGDDLVRHGVERLREGIRTGLLREDVDPKWLLIVLLTATKSWFTFRNEWRPFFGELSDEAYDEAYFTHMMSFFLDGVRPKDGSGT